MSRKKRARQGQIEFTGLRFFLQKMEGRVSRKELVEFVRRFFNSRGLEFDVLQVEFRRTQRPTSVDDGEISSICGLMHPGQNRVEIFLNTDGRPRTAPAVMRTVGHELDHVAWELEGRVFDDSEPWVARPHEIRAVDTGAKWRRWVAARI